MDKERLMRSANKYFEETYEKWYNGPYNNLEDCPSLTMLWSVKNNIQILPKIYTNGIIG